MKKSIASLLDLQEWIIYRFEMNEHHIDVYAGRPKKEARCPDCHALSHRVHSRTSRWRPKLHTWVDRKPVFLWVRPRRFRCPACGKVFTERLPGIRPWARMTQKAEAFLLSNLKDRSFRSAARDMNVSPGTLRRLLLKGILEPPTLETLLQDLPECVISIDEHSFRGQDMMITVTCLWPKKRLLAILPDDRLGTLKSFFERMPQSVKKRIRAVCIDLKDSWRKLFQRVLPGVVVVADHFHVLKDANRRVDEARLVEQSVSGHRLPRWPLVKNEEDLTERQASQLATIRKHFRNVAQFHWMKEQLRDVYRASSREEAKAILERVLLETEVASDAALVQWGRTLRRWKEEILAYHDWRVTNGYTEGVHTKIKMLKRISFGFRNRDVYVRKVLLAFVPVACLVA
nr:hypothetical protein [Bacillota bacterium]